MADITANIVIPGNFQISSPNSINTYLYNGNISLTANVYSEVTVAFDAPYNSVPSVFATLVSSGYDGDSPISPSGITSIYVHQVTTNQAKVRIISNTSQSIAHFLLLVIAS